MNKKIRSVHEQERVQRQGPSLADIGQDAFNDGSPFAVDHAMHVPFLQSNVATRGVLKTALGHDFSRNRVNPPPRTLILSRSGDQCEREADRIAGEVMRPSIEGYDANPPIQQLARDDPENARPIVEAKSIPSGDLQATGQPLDAESREFADSRLGADFSRVRVHTNVAAAESAKGVNALAYTVGRDVVFGTGQYAPGTNAGRKLLAHELVHVMQQTGGAQAKGFAMTAEPTIQRQESSRPESAPASPPQADVIPKFTFTTPELDVPIKGGTLELGPIELKSIAATADLTCQIEGERNKPDAAASQPTFSAGTSNIGYQAEIEKKWEDTYAQRLIGFTPTLSGGGSVTTKGGEVGIEGTLEGQNVTFGVGFNFVEVDATKHEVEFLTLSPKMEFHNLPTLTCQLADGRVANCELKATFELRIAPSEEAIRWATEKLANAAGEFLTTDALLSGSMVGIGIFTIVAFACAFADASELTELQDQTATRIGNFCQSYENVLRGEAPLDGPGAADGAAAAEDHLQTSGEKVPRPILIEESKSRDIYNEMLPKVADQIKQRVLDWYPKNHWFDTNINNGLAFRDLKRSFEGLTIKRPVVAIRL